MRNLFMDITDHVPQGVSIASAAIVLNDELIVLNNNHSVIEYFNFVDALDVEYTTDILNACLVVLSNNSVIAYDNEFLVITV